MSLPRLFHVVSHTYITPYDHLHRQYLLSVIDSNQAAQFCAGRVVVDSNMRERNYRKYFYKLQAYLFSFDTYLILHSKLVVVLSCSFQLKLYMHAAAENIYVSCPCT